MLCFAISGLKAKEHTRKEKAFTMRVFRLHLHPAQNGKGYVALALHRTLGLKLAEAKQLARFGGWAPASDLRVDQLIKLARRLDRLAKAPIAVVR